MQGQLQRQMAPPGPTNPDQEILKQLTVERLTATPSTIPICTISESIQFDWQVTEGVRDAEIQFILQVGSSSVSVGPVGSRSVPVTGPGPFQLLARLRNAGRILGIGSIGAAPSPNACQVAITTPTFSSCATPQVTAGVTSTVGSYAHLKSDPEWAIDPNGIHLHLALAVPAAADLIDVDLDATVLPVLNQGQLSLAYSDFSVHADFPWYVLLFNPVEVGEVELVINTVLIPVLKPELAGLVQQVISKIAVPQPGVPIVRIQLQSGQVVLTVCLPPGVPCIPEAPPCT